MTKEDLIDDLIQQSKDNLTGYEDKLLDWYFTYVKHSIEETIADNEDAIEKKGIDVNKLRQILKDELVDSGTINMID